MLYVPHLCISITQDEYSEQPNDTKRCNKISDLQLGGNPSFEIMISFGSSRELKTPTGCSPEGTEEHGKTPGKLVTLN